jgi:predicted Zn-dependent protease
VLKRPAAARLAGEVKWRQGDAKASADQFRAAGKDAVAQLGLARALAALGKEQQAVKPAKRAAQLLPGSAPPAQLAAGIALRCGKPEEAINALRVIHREDPLDPVTLTLMAMAYRHAGDAGQAAALEKQIKELQAQTDEPIDVAEELRRLRLGTLAATADTSSGFDPGR